MSDAGLIGKSASGAGLSGRLDAAAVRSFIGSLTQSQIEALIASSVAALVDSSPGTLDTLNELAAALGDDPNFAATTAAAIAAKYTKPGSGIPSTDLTAAVQTSLGKADTALQSVTPFAVTSSAATSITLGLSNARGYLRTTASSAVTITVPPQSSVTWAADTEIVIEQAGTGQITVAGGSGVTVRTSQTLKSGGQYGAITLKRVAADEWVLSGEREAA
jgi:hypothetical protein